MKPSASSRPPNEAATLSRRLGQRGFTLLEVIVAFTIFFLFAFSILEMTTRSLAAARAIQDRQPDAGMVASFLSLTNKLTEGIESGDLEDFYPGMFPDWHWSAMIEETASNGLFLITITLSRDGRDKGPAASHLAILRYAPESPPGSASGGIGPMR